jgi:NADPH-dependent 2,4-dienoyl-CoA reductase/sulfur reductase-like enzyme
VVGGGVAGLEAANVFSRRGHRVTVFEGEDRLGGLFRRASKAPGKQTYLNVIEYYEKALPERGVEIVLNSRQDGVPDGEWDLVVVAVGGEPIRPPIRAEGASVRLAADVLDAGSLDAENYVVVGDGLVGCEMADYILEKGRRAVLVGNDPRDPLTTQGVARWHFMKKRFENAGLEAIRHSTVRSIDGNGFVVAAEDGNERRVDGRYDYILACGFKPAREDALRRFQKEGLPVMVVGNAKTAGDAMDAIHDAFGQAVEYVF